MAFTKSTVKEPVDSSGNVSPSEDGNPQTNVKPSEAHLGSTPIHAFSDPATAEVWRLKYEKAGYENRHRFDPEFSWTADEEKKLVRKIDKRIMLWAWIMFCALDLHRRNINRAISDNMLEELGMDTNDFNYGQTVGPSPATMESRP